MVGVFFFFIEQHSSIKKRRTLRTTRCKQNHLLCLPSWLFFPSTDISLQQKMITDNGTMLWVSNIWCLDYNASISCPVVLFAPNDIPLHKKINIEENKVQQMDSYFYLSVLFQTNAETLSLHSRRSCSIMSRQLKSNQIGLYPNPRSLC